MLRKLKTTADGSPTFYLPHKKETYHSKNGALTESIHVYIKCGMDYWLEINAPKSRFDILEVGFGTGLNFLLTSARLKNLNTHVSYDAIEAYPLSLDEIKEFSLSNAFKNYFSSQKLIELHKLSWNKNHQFESNVQIQKIESKVENFSFNQKYDLVYYDAFAKFSQPELWNRDLIQSIANQIKPNGVFVTYAAFAELRTTLKKSSMKIERLKGPIGKREITRALKC